MPIGLPAQCSYSFLWSIHITQRLRGVEHAREFPSRSLYIVKLDHLGKQKKQGGQFESGSLSHNIVTKA